LLYVLIIELLAAQLRSNPNIVGFTVGSEKITSLHYADDTTITITQNRSFKEVIKDDSCFKEVVIALRRYEDATGAKVNFQKTQGLWVGGWKRRAADPSDCPLGVKWTTGNVEHLGVFFGTDDPASHTFAKLLPKISKSLNYWKTFHLSKLAKARVLEIFVASKLLYAAKFYCMPKLFYTTLQKQFTQFVNWPRKQGTVCEAELFKMRADGGLQLLHLLTKSQASKCAWLVRLITLPALSLSLHLFTALFGEQLSHKQGVEILFSPHSYAKRLRFPSPFYKEAVWSFTSQSLQKHVPLEEVTQQLYFYSRIFVDAQGAYIPNTLRGAKRDTFRFYSQFMAEKRKSDSGHSGVARCYEYHSIQSS